MIICHCCVIRDSDIKKAVKDGAKSIKDIQCLCYACTECMGCAKAVRKIIEQEIDDKSDGS